jgi:hypothetical protein
MQKSIIIIVMFILTAFVFTSTVVYNLKPASAFQPRGHIQTANTAINEILAGSNNVTIDGRKYPVDSRVADAIRSYPDFYRGGVVGPDGFPDAFVGQTRIHPTTDKPPLTVANQWLRHVYDSAWRDYLSLRGNDEAKKILAFGYGYLTHAAGDTWAHTLVNDRPFSNGIATLGLNPQILGVYVRHIIVEAYIGKHTPTTNLRIDAPSDFVYRTFIENPTAKSLGNGPIFNYFFSLKDKLFKKSGDFTRQAADYGKKAKECLSGLQLLNPLCSASLNKAQQVIALAKRAYVVEWIKDINTGLRAWPQMSLGVSRALFAQESPDIDSAKRIVQDFALRHMLSMMGAPDAFGFLASKIVGVQRFVADLLGPVIEPLKDAKNRLVNYLIVQATGVDIQELKDFYSRPQNYINTNRIVKVGSFNVGLGFAPDTSVKLDNLMGMKNGFQDPNAKYNPEIFAAAKNSIVLSKLLLLTPYTLNQVLRDHGVTTPLYRSGNNGPGAQNAMLDWNNSLDGHHQWMIVSPRDGKSYGTGMPIWKDCTAREKVFAVIFVDYEKLPINQKCVTSSLPPTTPVKPPVSQLPTQILR